MFYNAIYYMVYTSVVLFYGIGINRTLGYAEKPRMILLKLFKILITVCTVSTLSYLFSVPLLVPVNLGEIYPFIVVLIYIFISVFLEAIIRITAKVSTSDYGLSLVFVLLALSESSTLLECVLNSVVAVLSLFILVPIIFCINKVLSCSREKQDLDQTSLMYISIAVIMISMLVWNISWLNPGVFAW